MKDGFIKAAAAAPELRVADPRYNTEKIIECIEKAKGEGVKLLPALPPVGNLPLHERPERRGMVELCQMAQLMHDNIVNYFWWCQH